MLIDAAHPEETRVAVVRGTKLEEFDFESAKRKQLRGNIYLAKVTRVEPSLQAAFVEYGGNRHGFLAFSEIHPDYYQIPVADRQALLEQEEFDAAAAEAEEEKLEASGAGTARNGADPHGGLDDDLLNEPPGDVRDEIFEDDEDEDDEADGHDEGVESVGAEDALEEVPRRATRRSRHYKIQEVIKRGQVILVQVVKEERGKKGAALTSYLSLAGRYCVLMPNTARGGGISRKITSAADRKRLRDIAKDFGVAQGAGIIIRTAGANRTKAEIKRDLEYLRRLWETVRDLTLESSAPALVYEEGSLIKRSIRDLYNKEIGEILVEGAEGYKEAKSFMRMLMPSHAKNVKLFENSQPIFVHHKIENQLDAMFSANVTLKSGGYIVINQTEALVSIDVNSGKATRERNIEDTALNTNLEASDEIARQLRLRDLAGLIVIDYIDMERRRNNRAVERRIKSRLKDDRARIQIGRISHFGLLEMSRQRLRSGILEGSTAPCPTCEGHGFVRSTESSSLQVLRAIDEHLMHAKHNDLLVRAPAPVALYILNQMRSRLLAIEGRFDIAIHVEADITLANSNFEILNLDDAALDAAGPEPRPRRKPAQRDEAEEKSGDGNARRRPRRSRGGAERGRKRSRTQDEDKAETVAADAQDDTAGEEAAKPASKRRRGRRGGRRVQQRRKIRENAGDEQAAAHADESEAAPVDAPEGDGAEQREPEKAKTPRKRARRKPAAAESEPAETGGDPAAASRDEKTDAPPRRSPEPATAQPPAGKPKKRKTASPKPEETAPPRRSPRAAAGNGAAVSQDSEADAPGEIQAEEAADSAARRGWWQRRRAPGGS